MEDAETYNIVMSSLCSVEVTSNLDQVISEAGYEAMLDNVSINLTDTLFREDEETYNIVMSSLCSVEVTSNLDQVISDAGYEVMLDNVSINLTDTLFMEDTETYNTVMLSLCSVEVTSNLDQVISDAGYKVMLDNVSISLTDTRERSGSDVGCLTQDQRAAGSSLTGVTVLRCILEPDIYPSLVLVQPRKTVPT